MDCKKYQAMLSEYIDGELSPKDEGLLLKHIDSCESCKSEFLMLKSLTASLKSSEEIELPENFHENLMKKIDKQSNKGVVVFFRKRSTISAIAAAVVLVFGLKFATESPVMYKNTPPSGVDAPIVSVDVPENLPESTESATNEVQKPAAQKAPAKNYKPKAAENPAPGADVAVFPAPTGEAQVQASDTPDPVAVPENDEGAFTPSMARMIGDESAAASPKKHILTIPADDTEFSEGEVTFEEYSSATLKYPDAAAEEEVLPEGAADSIYIIIKK